MFGWLVGSGLGATAGLVSYLVPAIRQVEERLADHDAVTAVAQSTLATPAAAD